MVDYQMKSVHLIFRNPKLQAPNNKQIPISKIPKSIFLIVKISFIDIWNLGYCDLRFVPLLYLYLLLRDPVEAVICYL